MWMRKNRVKIVFVIILWVVFNIIWQLLNCDIKHLSNYSSHYDKTKEKHERDWHNYKAVAEALVRSGLGEHGAAVEFSAHHKELYKEYGYDAVLSDQISINRSVPDTRPIKCKNMTYDVQLPKAAIIIIFYNERLSVLLRTVYSILNRTPGELLQEIILVDDGSTWPDVQAPLLEYLSLHLPPERSKARLLRLPERGGLMVARMTGARAASKKSQVLIFLDSHLEVMYDWLPPLLEPIVLNPKTCTCPVLELVQFNTFEYIKSSSYRGYFDWQLNYHRRLLSDLERQSETQNYREYVMMGGAMAIGADFFWQLGGFDEGMKLWGGEQYEISFKIWMCGGELLNVPCSRMGHLYRDPTTKGNTNLYKDFSFVSKNFRRLIDVWMDEEHQKYIHSRRPDIKNANPGDLTTRLALRERLQCQSFTWMLKNIMPDLKTVFPPIEPDDLGTSAIYSAKNASLCIALDAEKHVLLRICDTLKKSEQLWQYTWRGELHLSSTCLESDLIYKRTNSYRCHRHGGNQKWFYDFEQQWIAQPKYNHCMIANFVDHRVDLTLCEIGNLAMKWVMNNINKSAMKTLEVSLRN